MQSHKFSMINPEKRNTFQSTGCTSESRHVAEKKLQEVQ